MDLEELLKTGRVHKEKISSQEVQRALVRAERDLKTARKIMADDWDWGFSITYNAVLQASRALCLPRAIAPLTGKVIKILLPS